MTMRILHITPAYEPAWHLGGVVRSVSQMCRGLAAQGHEVTVFTTDSGGDRRMEVPVNRPVDLGGVEAWYFKTELSLRYFYSPALRETCRRRIKEFDIVHLASCWCYPEIPAISESKKLGVPYIISTRGTFLKYSMHQKALKKWIYYYLVERGALRGAQSLHYTAELERESMAYLGLRAPNFVIPNGFRLEEFSNLAARTEAKRALGLAPENLVVLYLGRLHARKGLEHLTRAFAEAAGQLPHAVLLLAGPDDGEEVKLKGIAKELGIAEAVHFPGYIPPGDRHLYWAAADLFGLVTYPGENFGNAAVEAMLSGVPVLVSEHVGISREVLQDGSGVVVPLEVHSIAAALVSMLRDPARLQAMGQAAATTARRRYDNTNVCRLMATVYEDILSGRRSPEVSWSNGGHPGQTAKFS
jgi:glycosyltransferase involved in cell wall biosynthesis